MDKKQKDRRGKVNYIWVGCGAYLIYLGYRVFSMFWKGTAGAPMFTVPAAAVFIAIGAVLLGREWRAYKYGKEHIDDPDTWSDEAAENRPADGVNPTEAPTALPDREDEITSGDGEDRGEDA